MVLPKVTRSRAEISSMRWDMPRFDIAMCTRGNGKRVNRDFHALALFAKQVLRVKHKVGELQARMASATATHHVRHWNKLEARGIVGNQEA